LKSGEFLFDFIASVSVSTVSLETERKRLPSVSVAHRQSRRGRRGGEGRRWSASVTWYGLATGVVLAVDAPAMPPSPEKAAVISPPAPPCLAIRPPHAPSLCVSLSTLLSTALL